MSSLLKHLPKTRKEAKELQVTYYYTGKPCKHGHVNKRLTSSADCFSCALIKSTKWKKNNWKKHLADCNKWKHEHADLGKLAQQRYYRNNKEKIQKFSKLWREQNPDRVCASANHRHACKLRATPKWANLDKILEFYQDASKLTKSTGIEHQVDHIIPLRGKLVCGLHVENNLQVLTATDNMHKQARYTP